MDDTGAELIKLKTAIANDERDEQRLEGRLAVLTDQLEELAGTRDVNKAWKIVRELDGEIKKGQERIEAGINSVRQHLNKLNTKSVKGGV